MKGYRPDEIIGKHFSVFYPTEERRAAVPDRELVDAMVDGMVSVQGWRVRQNGSRFWANATITPLWDRAGQLRGFAKLTRNETDHHATEQLRDQLTRIEEQERIAATLADTTVRRLYAMGLRLASALKMATDSHQAQKIEAAILEADIAINEMRTTVFESWRL
jgi:PAS domain S-box-containing protein